MAAPSKTVKIGKYDVIDTIGRGGMGVVYLARDPDLDRLVAIKMMNIDPHESGDFLERFDREAISTARLQHPNIVTVYERGEHQGRPFLVMAYLEGHSLEALLRSGRPMTLLEKISIIAEVCHGLGYAHQRGIIHRDIKPANIMVLDDESVKIVDFGIARLGDHTLTRTGQLVGTLSYMPPEQFRDIPLDSRADVYSTGVVLYQLLTNSLPFQGESTGSTLAKIVSDDPPPFRHFGVSCPVELEAITLKSLSKNRDDRYSTAEAFAVALAEVQDSLKQQTITDYLGRAELLQQGNELVQAQEYLVKVLKLDRHHTNAARLLSTVQAKLHSQLSSERLQQLKQQAEEAYAREDFERSLKFVNQAIEIENGPELEAFRSKIEKGKAEAELVRKSVARAEALQRSGDLDAAKTAIEDAFSRNPGDSKVRALRRAIQRDLEERDRQKRLERLLDQARTQMSARKFTAALDLLKEAQSVDPAAPQLRVLLEKLAAEHQQEKRRRELEKLSRELQEAIDRDDYSGASAKAAEALQKFPEEAGLARLKELADGQIELAVQKEFVRNLIAVAQQELDGGHVLKAVDAIERGLLRYPGDTRLESFRAIAHQRWLKDRAEADRVTCLQQAHEAIDLARWANAIELLESGQSRFGESTNIDELLRFARERQSKERHQVLVEDAKRNAQQLLAGQNCEEAVQVLEKAIERVPNEELDILLGQARSQLEVFRRDLQAAISKGRALLAQGASTSATEFLCSRPASYRQSPEFRDLQAQAQAASIRTADHAAADSAATKKFTQEQNVVYTSPVVEAAPAKSEATEMFRPIDAPEEPSVDQRHATGPGSKRVPVSEPEEEWSLEAKVQPPWMTRTGLIAVVAALILIVISIVVWQLVERSRPQKNAEVAVRPPVESAKPTQNDSPTEQPNPTKPVPPTSVQQVVTRRLMVSANVDDFRVWVDGVDMGSSKHRKATTIQLNGDGKRIRVTRAGYQDYEILIPIGSTLSVNLKPLEAMKSPITPNSVTQPNPSPVGITEQKPAIATPAVTTPPASSAPDPLIRSFHAIPGTIDEGSRTTVIWETENAVQVYLDQDKVDSPEQGQRDVQLTASKDFVLTAIGSSGKKTVQRTHVDVRPKPPEAERPPQLPSGPSDEEAINQLRVGYEREYQKKNGVTFLQGTKCNSLPQPLSRESVDLTCRYKAAATVNGSPTTITSTFTYTMVRRGGKWDLADVKISK